MRSLKDTEMIGDGTDIAAGGYEQKRSEQHTDFHNNLERLKRIHHSYCIFNRHSPFIPELQCSFDDEGVLHGAFTCTEKYQGYNGRVHGGAIAAIIDASMTQCLMGHGVVGYTADLSVKYRNPVITECAASIKICINSITK